MPVNQQIVTWDADGNPVVRAVRVFTKAQVSQIALAAFSQPYVDPNDELAIAIGLKPSRFYGMTNLEVAMVRQAEAAAKGDLDAHEALLDRAIGKPKQSVEKELGDNYAQALDRIAKAAAAKAAGSGPAGQVLDAEVVK